MSVFFDEIEVGDQFQSESRLIVAPDIDDFVRLSGDHNRLHTDDEWVRQNTPYRGRIAHGLLVLSASSGAHTPGLDDWQILAYLEVRRQMRGAIYPGDRVHTVYSVEALRRSETVPNAGIVEVSVQTLNQDGEVVQSGTDTYLVAATSDSA